MCLSGSRFVFAGGGVRLSGAYRPFARDLCREKVIFWGWDLLASLGLLIKISRNSPSSRCSRRAGPIGQASRCALPSLPYRPPGCLSGRRCCQLYSPSRLATESFDSVFSATLFGKKSNWPRLAGSGHGGVFGDGKLFHGRGSRREFRCCLVLAD